MIEIVSFKSEYAKAFKELNIAWLKKYFHVEPKDSLLLENCQEYIIDQGGYIFIALANKEPVGCFSFIPMSNNIYELGKMAVQHNFQGQKIGQQLMIFAINFAKRHKWKSIMLYSSTKLPAALHVYKKHGFKLIELEKDLPYVRSDIKMELNLIKIEKK